MVTRRRADAAAAIREHSRDKASDAHEPTFDSEKVTLIPEVKEAWAATSGYIMRTIANANLLAESGTAEQVDVFVRPMLGSSLADIATRAEPQHDGTYRVFGSKMWISGVVHRPRYLVEADGR